MGTTVEKAYSRFHRIVVTPYWCEGSPLAWWHTEANIGIAHLAKNVSVGHFNLAWWLLARSTPPQDAKVYANTNIKWVIVRAPQIRVGNYTLTEWASFMTLPEWQAFVVAQEKQAFRFGGEGLSYSDLKWLALTGSNVRPL